MDTKPRIDPTLELDKTLRELAPRPQGSPQKGIHQLLDDVEATADLLLVQIRDIRDRVKEFDTLATQFYTGERR